MNAFIQPFVTENVFQEAHDLVARASQRLEENKMEFKTRCFNAIWEFSPIFSATEKVCYIIRAL